MQYIIRLEWFIILVLLQVLVLNHIHFEQYATPLFYIYFLLKIDSGNSRKGLMLWAFSLGLCIDIFSNTPGLNAAAAVCTAFCRPWFLRLFSLRDITDNLNLVCTRWDLLLFSDIPQSSFYYMPLYWIAWIHSH